MTISSVIGQYRYSGSGAVTVINPVLSYKPIAMSTGSSVDSTSFQDIQISPANGTFLQNQDYYFKISIPQDMNYTLSFDVQLIKTEASGTSEVYQFIKNVTIERGGSGTNAYIVVLYEDLDGNVSAMVPLPYVAGTQNTRNLIYYQESTDRFYIGNGGTSYSRYDKLNNLSVVASWRQETGDNFGIFEMTFRPIDSGFSHIHLKMVRTAEDYNIQRVNPDGSTEFGRKIDINKVTATLYSLNNLIDTVPLSPSGILSRIGVWSHPGLVMIINGEEIRVTANGYYELDALPITSLGVVAPDNDYTNFFTIDYAYDNAEG